MYMGSFPILPEDFEVATYTDDKTISTSGPIVDELSNEMNLRLTQVKKWLTGRSLALSAGKSTATIFIILSNEVPYNPKIVINGNEIPLTIKRQ